jgi:hypothetical protein
LQWNALPMSVASLGATLLTGHVAVMPGTGDVVRREVLN